MNNLVVNTPGAAGQVKTAVGLWRFGRKLDAATIRRTCERTHGKCGQRLPLDHRYFHAVPVLAELLSNARRAGTMDSSEAQESTRTQSLEHISCCQGITRRTPAAAWPF